MHLLYTPSQHQYANTPRYQSRRPKQTELHDGKLWLVDVEGIVGVTERNGVTSLDNSRKQDSVPVFYKKSM
ncbi:hypothetical protein CEP53_014964 [Fusarium sp. AF-6]|nr:hypothetical protein CEP53_014964 [Fusarium sp. AF-6]